VNCGALPATLVESELFGVKKGAFTGASEDRPGLVRSADGGTLFLDEIADLPPPSQAAFLRVLQEREVVPVGGTRAVPVDLRVVAATHRDLDALVAAGQFRQDLRARLDGFRLELPPLRERREDLGLLLAALLRRAAPRAGEVQLRPTTARALLAHTWPENTREVERRLATAIALAEGAPIGVEHLGDLSAVPAGVAADPPPPARPSPVVAFHDEVQRLERSRILEALDRSAGNQTRAAALLGIPRRTFVKRLATHGIRRPRKP
jgi:DNA-binding NtrC family response regulator